MTIPFSRRELLRWSALGCGTLLIPRWSWGTGPATPEPHFFLQIFLDGAADPNCMFDARPMSMTAAEKVQNYFMEEPSLYTGVNGVSSLMTSPMKALLPYRDRMTVLNGVQMLTSFDGHGQNINYYFTGSPFGGESFLPHLNEPRPGHAPTSIDTIQSTFSLAEISNGNATVNMNASQVGGLLEPLSSLQDLDSDPELAAHLRSRFQVNSSGAGRFSQGSAQMFQAVNQMDLLRHKLLQLPSARAGVDPETQFVELLGGAFRQMIANSAIWVIENSFDVHSQQNAKKQPENFQKTSGQLARIFAALAGTPYDSQRSLFDVTTVVVTSDFGRTMRQPFRAFAETGTDHNPLSNSVILAGKGIRPGLVVGSSDLADEHEQPSGAHLQMDDKLLKVMGRPFDFANLRSRTDRPATFVAEEYLNVDSVVNTLYTLFGVSDTHFRKLTRSGPAAPVLSGLLL